MKVGGSLRDQPDAQGAAIAAPVLGEWPGCRAAPPWLRADAPARRFRSTGRVVLVEPGLAQHLVAAAKIATEFHGLRRGHRKIELGAPVTRHVVGNGLREDVGELAAGSREDRSRKNALGELGQGLAFE